MLSAIPCDSKCRVKEETSMKPLQTDLSIYSKFGFENPPVGVKFLLTRPEGIERLDKTLALCEMIKEAQGRKSAFYAIKENENCFGKMALGMMEGPDFAESGQIGAALEVYEEPRCNSRLYQHVPMFLRNTVNYVVFSPIDSITFDPDLLIFLAKPAQAEILLRAMSYSTGEIWEPKNTPVLGCAWLFVYPYQSGKVNYTITGLHFGMKAKQVYPEGQVLMSVPFNWIPVITENLKKMKWVLPSYSDGREAFLKREEDNLQVLIEESERTRQELIEESKCFG
jgi:uncharacterized protein (DUF169 family)